MMSRIMTREQLKTELGKRIIRLREQKGWSQSDFARACNKDRQAIEKLENGKVNPTLYTYWNWLLLWKFLYRNWWI